MSHQASSSSWTARCHQDVYTTQRKTLFELSCGKLLHHKMFKKLINLKFDALLQSSIVHRFRWFAFSSKKKVIVRDLQPNITFVKTHDIETNINWSDIILMATRGEHAVAYHGEACALRAIRAMKQTLMHSNTHRLSKYYSLSKTYSCLYHLIDGTCI